MDVTSMRVIGRDVLPLYAATMNIRVRCKSDYLVVATTQHGSLELWSPTSAKNEWMPSLVEF